MEHIIAVIGSRSFDNYELLKKHLDEIIAKTEGVVRFVSGGAKGADSLAEKYAKENNISIMVFKPDYVSHGKSAPFVRNKVIIDTCTEVVAFWDGSSRGTLHAKEYAEASGKGVYIVPFFVIPKAPEKKVPFFERELK